MGTASTPQLSVAKRVLPAPLLKSLAHVFAQGIEGCVLAGGTALAGFYAGHRRSDDLDLFTESESSQRASVLAAKSLSKAGAKIETLSDSNQYYEANAEMERHRFKITVVLDTNLFRVGRSVSLDGKIQVVDLDTLFKMKAATLVSRCSEKDLYDLTWLFHHFDKLSFVDLIRLGQEIDGGMDGESVIASVSGAILRESACDFALPKTKTAAAVFKEIEDFRKKLLRELAKHMEDEPTPPLGELVRKLKKLH